MHALYIVLFCTANNYYAAQTLAGRRDLDTMRNFAWYLDTVPVIITGPEIHSVWRFQALDPLKQRRCWAQQDLSPLLASFPQRQTLVTD